eukprot:1107224-Rhodomonas_salina.2
MHTAQNNALSQCLISHSSIRYPSTARWYALSSNGYPLCCGTTRTTRLVLSVVLWFNSGDSVVGDRLHQWGILLLPSNNNTRRHEGAIQACSDARAAVCPALTWRLLLPAPEIDTWTAIPSSPSPTPAIHNAGRSTKSLAPDPGP